MTSPTQRNDPLERHFAWIERQEKHIDVLSWLAIAAFSIYVLLHAIHSHWDSLAKLIFIFFTMLAIAFSYWFRFAAQPPADRKRRRLLIQDAIGSALTTDKQNLYWNNRESQSVRRLLMNLAENTFFVPRMLRAELGNQIALALVFSIGLLISIRFGTAEVVELFAVLLVFSEVILGKLVRMVWTLIRVKHLHIDIIAALRDRAPTTTDAIGRTLFLLGEYEYIKARGGYRASDHTFAQLNPVLTKQWNTYRDTQL